MTNKDEKEASATCSNHPDRPAVVTTDGVAANVVSFCKQCCPDNLRG